MLSSIYQTLYTSIRFSGRRIHTLLYTLAKTCSDNSEPFYSLCRVFSSHGLHVTLLSRNWASSFYQKSKFNHQSVSSFLFFWLDCLNLCGRTLDSLSISSYFILKCAPHPTSPFLLHTITHFQARKAVPCLWEERLCLHWFKSRITMPRTGI